MKLKVDHPISQWPHVELTNCATAMPSYALPCCLKYCNCTSCLQMIPNNTLNWLRHQFKPFDTPVPRYCKGCKRSSCFKFGEWSSYQRNTIDQFCDSEVTHMGQGISHPLSSLLTAFRWDFTSSILTIWSPRIWNMLNLKCQLEEIRLHVRSMVTYLAR